MISRANPPAAIPAGKDFSCAMVIVRPEMKATIPPSIPNFMIGFRFIFHSSRIKTILLAFFARQTVICDRIAFANAAKINHTQPKLSDHLRRTAINTNKKTAKKVARSSSVSRSMAYTIGLKYLSKLKNSDSCNPSRMVIASNKPSSIPFPRSEGEALTVISRLAYCSFNSLSSCRNRLHSPIVGAQPLKT